MLSPNKESLIQQATRENTQEFEVRPTLAEFTRLLRIITEEIVSYRIWPVCVSNLHFVDVNIV